MTPALRFALEPDVQQHRLRSRLLVDRTPAATWLPGRRLVRQFITVAGHLLITDFDCPCDETTSIILLDERFRAVSWRSMGTLFSLLPVVDATFRVRSVRWADPHHFAVHGDHEEDSFAFTIRRQHIPFLYPRLGMRRLGHARTSE